MSIAKVKEYLQQFGLDGEVKEFNTSSATVELAAKALNCPPSHIAKTLSFMVADKPVLIVAAGDAKIDNQKFKAYFHTKAKMLSPQQVEELVGYSIGGVCPFAVNEGVEIYLDESLKRFENIYPACGSANSAIGLTIPQLTDIVKYKAWIDVCKNWA